MSIAKAWSAGGFFCDSTIRMDMINYFIYRNKKLPEIVDSKESYSLYKNSEKNGDLTYEYFEDFNNMDINIDIDNYIKFTVNDQFKPYTNYPYEVLSQVINKYFSPSKTIKNTIIKIEKKYELTNEVYNNICVLFYRGNDKNTETQICNPIEYIDIAKLIVKNNPNTVFLVQSDETNFINLIHSYFPYNILVFKDEIRHIDKNNKLSVDKINRESNFEFSKNFLSITIIMSKCKYIICGSGNCDQWITFFRNNNKNICQNCKGTWYTDIDLIKNYNGILKRDQSQESESIKIEYY